MARDLSENAMTFSVRGEDTYGSQGSSATFGATVTKVRNGNITYHPLEFTGNEGEVTLTSFRTGDEHYLSIGVWTESWDPNKIYSEKLLTMNTISNPLMASFRNLLVNHPMSLVHQVLVSPVASWYFDSMRMMN